MLFPSLQVVEMRDDSVRWVSGLRLAHFVDIGHCGSPSCGVRHDELREFLSALGEVF